jgi:hypothetical protein
VALQEFEPTDEVDADALPDHDGLNGVDPNDHVDHTTVNIDSGEGLQGGGDISTTRTLALDFNSLTEDSSPTTADDVIAFYDDDEGAHNKITMADLMAALQGLITHGSLNAGAAPPVAAHPPTGGALGAVLTKLSGADFDFGWVAPSGAFNLPGVQARRTTSETLVDSVFIDIDLDATDIENNSAVLDHDAPTNEDNIDIGATGLYFVFYRMDFDLPAQGSAAAFVEARVRVNDGGTGILGSLARTTTLDDSSLVGDTFNNSVYNGFLASLSSGDFITLQAQFTDEGGGPDVDTLAGGIIFGAIALFIA